MRRRALGSCHWRKLVEQALNLRACLLGGAGIIQQIMCPAHFLGQRQLRGNTRLRLCRAVAALLHQPIAHLLFTGSNDHDEIEARFGPHFKQQGDGDDNEPRRGGGMLQRVQLSIDFGENRRMRDGFEQPACRRIRKDQRGQRGTGELPIREETVRAGTPREDDARQVGPGPRPAWRFHRYR